MIDCNCQKTGDFDVSQGVRKIYTYLSIRVNKYKTKIIYDVYAVYKHHILF
jgi:hypothetical protein